MRDRALSTQPSNRSGVSSLELAPALMRETCRGGTQVEAMQQLLSESLEVWPNSSWYLYREGAIALAAVSHTSPDGFLEVVEDAWHAGAPLPMPVLGKAAALYRQRRPPHGSRSHGAGGAWGAELRTTNFGIRVGRRRSN